VIAVIAAWAVVVASATIEIIAISHAPQQLLPVA
jgi:hypothetical protein